ncbi:unnamed protein product [Auanema sp. JU1783]|nr:unnamed protein product [Auanema sp. JU1783]
MYPDLPGGEAVQDLLAILDLQDEAAAVVQVGAEAVVEVERADVQDLDLQDVGPEVLLLNIRHRIVSVVVLKEALAEAIPAVRQNPDLDHLLLTTRSPLVFCEEKLIRIEFETLEPFSGKVFVKGEYHNQHCSQTYANGRRHEDHTTENEVLSNTEVRILVDPIEHSVGKKPEMSALDQRENSTTYNIAIQKNSNLSSNWTGTGGSTTHSKQNRMPYPSAFGGIQTEVRRQGEMNERTRDRSPITVFQKSPSMENVRGNSEQFSSAPVCPPCSCDSQDIRSRRNTNQLTFTVPLGDCNAKRERILVPPSLITSFVIIVSFHESFITKLDRAYHIQCAYTESSRPVIADLNVSMSVPSSINSTVKPPKCDYSIIDGTGRNAQDVRVGDLVKHQWKCDTTEPGQYKMLVHDCYVESGMNEKQKLIDDHGCTLDKYTFSTPTYSDNLTVTVDSYIFKFPDKSAMEFRCAIKLCTVHDLDCVIHKPEECDQQNRKRRSSASEQDDYAVLYSNSLTVLDKGNMDEASTSSEGKRQSMALEEQSFLNSFNMPVFSLSDHLDSSENIFLKLPHIFKPLQTLNAIILAICVGSTAGSENGILWFIIISSLLVSAAATVIFAMNQQDNITESLTNGTVTWNILELAYSFILTVLCVISIWLSFGFANRHLGGTSAGYIASGLFSIIHAVLYGIPCYLIYGEVHNNSNNNRFDRDVTVESVHPIRNYSYQDA